MGVFSTETGSTGDSKELAADKPAKQTSSASLLGIFWSFFKIGAFTFGGGWAMIPLIRKELVFKRKWMEDQEFVDILAVAQSGPGPIAINTSVIGGYKMRGLPGAIVATLGSSLPSFLVILVVAAFFLRIKNSTAVEAVFKGMRPAIFGLLTAAVWQVGKTSIKNRRDVVFALLAGFVLLAFKVNPIFVVLAAAVAGIVMGWIEKSSKTRKEKEEGN